jgi:hypothetical protein
VEAAEDPLSARAGITLGRSENSYMDNYVAVDDVGHAWIFAQVELRAPP